MTVAYVILHYLAGKDTLECAASILEATAASCHKTHIVIVDNGSTNDSYGGICAVYANHPQVTLLHSDENLGFARGNNLGFRYAKYDLQADFIVMLNNDTILSQKDFNEVLVRKFEETGYGVLGPDIITADGYHQNPGNKQRWGQRELLLFRMKRRLRTLLSYTGLVSAASAGNKAGDYRKETLNGDQEHTILHGACWIFSPAFICCRDGLCPDTFLYMEEDILKLQADLYGYQMRYSADLSIFHKEDASTNMLAGTDAAKVRRKNRHLIRSSRVYSSLLRKKAMCAFAEKWVGKVKGSNYHIDPDMDISYLLGTVLQWGVMLLRGMIRRTGMKQAGKALFVGHGVKMRCKSRISAGSGTTIQNGVHLDALSRNGLVIGKGCSIGSGTIIRCTGNMKELGYGFVMGDRSSLADNCFVGASGGVWIGDDVIGGQNIRFHSSNHNFADTAKPIRLQGTTAKGIRIGNDCWIGAGAVFCDGVTIGDGCVVGANSVVTKSFPAGCVIAGVPAKVIRMRGNT